MAIFVAGSGPADVWAITSTSDAEALVTFHAGLSTRTRYLRYFSAYPRIPERDLNRFINVDHHDRVALVALLGSEIIAVGRYEREHATAHHRVRPDLDDRGGRGEERDAAEPDEQRDGERDRRRRCERHQRHCHAEAE